MYRNWTGRYFIITFCYRFHFSQLCLIKCCLCHNWSSRQIKSGTSPILCNRINTEGKLCLKAKHRVRIALMLNQKISQLFASALKTRNCIYCLTSAIKLNYGKMATSSSAKREPMGGLKRPGMRKQWRWLGFWIIVFNVCRTHQKQSLFWLRDKKQFCLFFWKRQYKIFSPIY